MKYYKATQVYLLLAASLVAIIAGPVYQNTFCMEQKCPYNDDFKCKTSGVCIRSQYVCNGQINCNDGSDEENCGTPNFGCHGYLCDNRTRCISYTFICDGYPSCHDKYDESYCSQRPCPYNGDIKCNDGKCLRSSLICDGYSHCPAGEDEQNCDLNPCPYNGYFRCGTGECIPQRYVCDRYNNCRDGSDEIKCTYGCLYAGDVEYVSMYYSHDPFLYYFYLSSGRCFRSYEYCSYSWYNQYFWLFYREFNTNCSTVSCPYDTDFRCLQSGVCIRYYDVCDGYSQCNHGEDEQNCNSMTCSATDDFICVSSGACIHRAQVCDGAMHCSDGSDEANCTSRSCYFPEDAKCRDNGKCIHSDMICNGINDCMDGSDEEDCASRPCPYSDDRRCNSSQACIRADRWCNQQVDCMDASDEENCYNIPCLYAGDFRCAYNGYCIRGYDVCDGYEHCLDGSDEGMNYCPEVFTVGIHWERTLTKTTNTHKCSDIHPSFKLTDVITRECLRNRTWAPVNISQCVMNSDSPVVMIVTVSLDTNSISLVKSKEDMIIQEMNQMIAEQPVSHVEFIQSVSNTDVSLKMTFEFNTFTTTELLENITYDMNLTTLGNLSVATAPQLIIFESTDVCQCPDSVTSSKVQTDTNNLESIIAVLVCSAKPCEYSIDRNFTYQCAASFVGDGRICGKDSDKDGYPDMELRCNDSHCIKDNCPTVHNPNQNLEACNEIQTQEIQNTDDVLSTAAAVGITFTVTLIISISCTLLIGYIVYRIKQPAIVNETIANNTIATAATIPKDTTNKVKTASCNNGNYEYPENYSPGMGIVRYQDSPVTRMQANPAYSMESFDRSAKPSVYENL